MWPEIKGDIITSLRKLDVDDMATTYFDRCLEYTVPKRLLPRFIWPKIVLESLSKNVSEEDIRLAYILGWCHKFVSYLQCQCHNLKIDHSMILFGGNLLNWDLNLKFFVF